MKERLYANWVYGGALAGVLLLVLAPLLVGRWPAVLALTFLHLPVYMLHQYEEHDKDRFRLFVNNMMGGAALSPAAVFAINIPGVWGVICVALYLAAWVNVGCALIAVYLVLVNAAAHIGQAVLLRMYNPGLASGALLFVPLGGCSLYEVQRAGGGAVAFHLLGFATAMAIHAGIVLYARRGAAGAPRGLKTARRL
jgi:hypothetical protein